MSATTAMRNVIPPADVPKCIAVRWDLCFGRTTEHSDKCPIHEKADLMKPMIREIIKARDRGALAEYLRNAFGLTLTDAHLRSIMEQAARAGGPEHSPWSDSTWRMWLKGKATQPFQPATSSEPRPVEASAGVNEVEAALMESSGAVFSTSEFEFHEMRGADELRADCPDEVWDQLFPAFADIGNSLKAQFEAHGGGKLLGKAPFASWLYARLVFLGLPGVEQENDLGGYWIHFVVKTGGLPVGVLFADAASDRVALDLEARTSDAGERIKAGLFDLLLKDIKEVARCDIEVRGAELGWTNSYGYTGDHFLGAANVSG